MEKSLTKLSLSSKQLDGLSDLDVLSASEQSPAPPADVLKLDKDLAALCEGRPWIRQAGWLYAKGFSRDEIAEACGTNSRSISLILGTPGFRKLVSEYMVAAGGSQMGVQRQITRAAMEAFMNIVALAERAQSEQVRLKANQDILDRALGRAPQLVRQEDTTPTNQDPLEEAKRLDAHIIESTKRFQQEGLLIEKALPES
jgi:hypothetical protein